MHNSCVLPALGTRYFSYEAVNRIGVLPAGILNSVSNFTGQKTLSDNFLLQFLTLKQYGDKVSFH